MTTQTQPGDRKLSSSASQVDAWDVGLIPERPSNPDKILSANRDAARGTALIVRRQDVLTALEANQDSRAHSNNGA